MYAILVGIAEESVANEVGASMCNEAVTFHLSHAETTITGASLKRLASKHSNRTTGTRVDLIVNQVLQALVERGSDEDSRIHRPASMALVHGFISVALVTHRMETLTDVINLDIRERCGIALATLENCNLPQNTLNQLCDSHTGRDSMGIHNDVWHNSFTRKRHIFLAIRHSNCSFLSMPGCKLITNLWNTNIANSNLGEAVSLLRGRDKDVVNNTVLVRLHRRGAIPFRVAGRSTHAGRVVRGGGLSNKDIVPRDTSAWCNKTIIIQFGIITVLHTPAAVHGGSLKQFRV
jgi:hypothetical protein